MYPRDQLFSEKRKFKRLKMDGLNDTIRIKKNEVDLILYSFTPSDMNFQTIWMSKVFLAKSLSEKSWSLGTILILGML